MAKPARLIFKGRMIPVAYDEVGNVTRKEPDRFVMGVPARTIEAFEFGGLDLDAKRIKELIAGDDPLYVAEFDEPESQPEPVKAKTEDAPAEPEKAGKRG